MLSNLKLSNAIVILAAIAGVSNASPAPASGSPAGSAGEGRVSFVSSWNEAGLQRYRFYSYGVADKNKFVHAFQNCGGISNNWQAWDQDGHGVFDDSEVVGIAGARVISCGIKAVTGQSCHDISEIGC